VFEVVMLSEVFVFVWDVGVEVDLFVIDVVLFEMDVFEFVSWIMCELFVVCVFYMLGYMNVVVEGLFI